MGLLDSVVGALGAGGGGGGQGDLLGVVMKLIGQNGGDLAGLVSKFQQGGLGDVVGSWVSTGQNLPVSPDQLSHVLGKDTIGNLAQQLGVSHGDLAGQLSQLLPQVVDKMTPQGQMPAAGAGGGLDLGGLLGSLLQQR